MSAQRSARAVCAAVAVVAFYACDYDIGPGSRPGSAKARRQQNHRLPSAARKRRSMTSCSKIWAPIQRSTETQMACRNEASPSPRKTRQQMRSIKSCSRGSATAKILACRVKTIRWRS